MIVDTLLLVEDGETGLENSRADRNLGELGAEDESESDLMLEDELLLISLVDFLGFKVNFREIFFVRLLDNLEGSTV